MLQNFLIVKNYKIDKTKSLSTGQKSQIFECVNQETQENLAVKLIRKQQNLPNWNLQKQVLELVQQESHTNIIKVYDLLENNEYWFIFMEYCDQSLETLIQDRKACGFETDQINNIMQQILQGYMHLRSKEIILRDLSPKSILVKYICNKTILKISDFSTSIISRNNQAYTSTGVPLYIAPEVFMNSNNAYNDQCDVYSLGVILHRLCYNGEFPEKILDQQQLLNFYQKIKDQSFICRENGRVSPDFKQLIEKMIVYDPNKRLTWQKLDMQPLLLPKLLIWQNKYLIDFGTLIGQGQQGQAYETFDIKTKEKLLTKKVLKIPVNEREKEIFSKIKGHDNENVIPIFEIFEIKDFYYIIMEKCDMNLEDYFKKQKESYLSKDEILDFAKQIITGYIFLKKNNIVHRDLKLTNIVVKINQNSKAIYKIIDLGTGKIVSQNNLAETKLGTPIFSAPEVLKGGQVYDDTCDIFSFGLILYYLIFKKNYFQVQTEKELKAAHEDLKVRPAKLPQYEDSRLIKLIEKMLIYDNNYRLKWEVLKEDELFSNKQNQVQPQSLNNQQPKTINNKIKIVEQNQIQIQLPQNNNQQPENNYSMYKFEGEQQQKSVSEQIVQQQNFQQQNVQWQNIQQQNVQQQNIQQRGSSQSVQQQQATQSSYSTEQSDITIQQYLMAVIQLSLKLINTIEEQVNAQFPYYIEVQFLSQFLIRFCTSCYTNINSAELNSSIRYEKTVIKFRNSQLLSNSQIQSQELLIQIKEKDAKVRLIIAEIPKCQIKQDAEDLKQQMSMEQQQSKHFDVGEAHKYLQLYYTTFRNEIQKLDDRICNLTFKYLLERINNIFNDFPIKDPLQYQTNKIYSKIISTQTMENYLKKFKF